MTNENLNIKMKNKELKDILIGKINKSYWWHVPPRDPGAYKKRGKFLASTYIGAEFYGRPNIEPEKVHIANPVFGFSEKEILEQLFPGMSEEMLRGFENDDYNKNWYNERIALDRELYRRAKKMGYDAIVLMGSNGREYLERNRKPHSIELNLINVK